MTETIRGTDVAEAACRAAQALLGQVEYLTELDQAIGDGDLGITMGRLGEAVLAYCGANPADDIGKYLFQLGTATNKAASSSMGTLTSGALMSAGKLMRGRAELTPADLAAIFVTAGEDIQTRGKAHLGDKTILDALQPAAAAFKAAVDAGAGLQEAGAAAVKAATAGRDSVTPLRSKVGRASWVGERTEGKVDPGCAMFVIVLEAITGRK